MPTSRHRHSAAPLTFAAAALFTLAAARSAGADLFVPSDFQLLATHPEAAMQGTERGRTIANLTSFAGGIFAGYGDWVMDTGPITIRSLDPLSGQWSAPLLSFESEAVSHFRPLGGLLYAPNVDPAGLPGVNPGGYALGVPGAGGTSWSQIHTGAAAHVFDVNSRSAGELWMTGSMDTQAAVWRSVDGGQSFSAVRVDSPSPGQPPYVFSQYRGVGILNDRIYVQRMDVNGSDVASSLVYEDGAWSDGPDLLPDSDGFLFRPMEYGSFLVYMDGDRSLGNFYKFDGAHVQVAHSEQFRDFTIAYDVVYGLTDSSKIVMSSNLADWTVLGTAPDTASSLAVVGSSVLLGTTDGSILRAASASINAVPEPSTAVLVACAGLAGFSRRFLRRISGRKHPRARVL